MVGGHHARVWPGWRAPATLLAALAALLVAPVLAHAQQQLPAVSAWDGTNPFQCTQQFLGVFTIPTDDPECHLYDGGHPRTDAFGVVDFILNEPARAAAQSDSCFYFQFAHWRGSIAQEDGTSRTYTWDGRVFFDKARGAGGVWVGNVRVGNDAADPSALPGMPVQYAPYFGPGTGGVITAQNIEMNPKCVAQAGSKPGAIYAVRYQLPNGDAPALTCPSAAGAITRDSIGDVSLNDTEASIRRRLGPPTSAEGGFLHYCLADGGGLLVGEPGVTGGEAAGDSTAPSRMLITTSPQFRLHGIGTGSTERALRRRFHRAVVVLRRGATAAYRAEPRAGVLFGVRNGRVSYLAVYDPLAIATTRELADYIGRGGAGWTPAEAVG